VMVKVKVTMKKEMKRWNPLPWEKILMMRCN
jgi:hypothetical protein